MIFELDETSERVLDRLAAGPKAPGAVAETPEEEAALRELAGVGAVARQGAPLIPIGGLQEVDGPPPIRTVVLNVTNSCNLACRYCYEYGDDRIAEAEVPMAMTEEVARQSVDRLITDSGEARDLQVTFFGGETLLNWRVIRPTVEYAREQAQQAGKRVDFSLTTNATLLTREVSQWIADNGIGVTISVDGDKQFQDSMRVYRSGMGSYDVIAPRIAEFLKLQKRPVGARVTITSKNLDVPRIFEHLMGLGFYEVGFAPVTSSPDQDYALGEEGFDELLDQFRDLADDYVEAATEGRYLGFSNLSDLLGEIHEGVSKAYPCGAGLGLVGVAPRRRSRPLPPVRRVRRSRSRPRGHRHRRRTPRRTPEEGAHRRPHRLQSVLGPQSLLGGLLPRGAGPLRRPLPPQPSLLRLDPRLDGARPFGVRAYP